MRKITFNTDEAFNELETARAIIGAAPQKGYTIQEVRKALRVLEALDAGPEITLEDADWSFLNQRVSETPWRVASPAVVAFCDKIGEAQAIHLNPA
jgi:predicted aconitase